MEPTFYNILPSGLKIVHRHTVSEVAYIGVMTGAGTRNETPDINGIAHYIEHCVFKGAERNGRPVSARQIIRKIEDVGGEINAYTTKEETAFYAAVPKQYLSRTLQLIAAMVQHPTFPKKETDKEVQVIYDEIESYNDSPSELIYDDFENMLFDGSSLALPILGTHKTLRHISRNADTALQWMHRHYLPQKTVVFCQSDSKPSAFDTLVRKAFDDWQISEIPTEMPQTYTTAVKDTFRSFKKHTHQAHVMMGGLSYPLGHKDQLAMYLLNNILGGGSLSSRLNLNLREQHGLVYTIESQYTPLSDTGYWSIYFASEPQHQEECIKHIREELTRLTDKRLSQTQFQRALIQLHGQMAISAENRENDFLSMGKMMLYHNNAPTWQETFRKITQLTPDDLFRVANEMFRENTISTLLYE